MVEGYMFACLWFAALHSLSVKKMGVKHDPSEALLQCVLVLWPAFVFYVKKPNWSPGAEAHGHFFTLVTAKANSNQNFFATTTFLSFTHDGPQSLPFQITQSICSSSLSPKVTNTSCWGRGKPYCSRCLCCDLARKRISSLFVRLI